MDGIILIDKPSGPTSAEIVRLVKWRLGKRSRVGHLGTLDPFATGVLPILVGEGTKLAPFLQESAKEYDGIIALGAETDTLDRTGEVVRTADAPACEPALLADIAARFTGEIDQTPPIFSAIKRGGTPLYRLARRGDEVEPPPPRRVTIMRLTLEAVDANALRFGVSCSPGMYVRSLARDIGVALHSAAHLKELRRVRNGNFTIARARPLDSVLASLEGGNDPGLIGLRDAIEDTPEVQVDAATERRLRNGDSRALDGLAPAGASLFKIIARGDLIAIAKTTSRITATIARVFGSGDDGDRAEASPTS
jgi:tRNA pseudouridine55 synthase